MTDHICSICFRKIQPHPITGWCEGNNAQPINDGRCCDECDNNVVIPARINKLWSERT